MKRGIIFTIIICFIIFVVLLLINNDKNNNNLLKAAGPTIDWNEYAKNPIRSNYDFQMDMSYYFPLGVALMDNNLVTIDDNNQLLCVDEFGSSNNENNTVKIKNCSNDYSQKFQIKDFSLTEKLYSSVLQKCLTKLDDYTVVPVKTNLIFSDCKAPSNAIQNFKMIDNKIAYTSYNNPNKWLSYSNDNNSILIDISNAAPSFQFLNFNQKCNSNTCTNLTNLENGYFLILDTKGTLKLLKESYDKDFIKIYTKLWDNEIKLENSKYNISFDNDGELIIKNTNNIEVWNTRKHIKTQEYKNKTTPYKLEMINDKLVVTNGKNEIMYTIHPHPKIIDCQVSTLTETLCYNNNLQYRSNILTPPSGNGIDCVNIANTSYGYTWDISETIQTLIPNSFTTQKFVYRNQSCSTPNPSFIEFGNCQNADSYYYYYLGKSDDLSFKKRILVLCYDDKDRLIGVKSQPDVNVSASRTFENIKANFLSPTIMPSSNTLVLSKPYISNPYTSDPSDPNTLTFIVNTSVFEDSKTKKAYKSNDITMFLGYRINMSSFYSLFGPNEYPLTDFKKPNNYTSGSVNIQWTMSGLARGLAGSGIGSFNGGLRLYDKSFQLLRTFTVGRAWNNIGTFTNLTETFNITINENQFPLYIRQYVERAGEEMWRFNATFNFNFNLSFITYTLEPFSVEMY